MIETVRLPDYMHIIQEEWYTYVPPDYVEYLLRFTQSGICYLKNETAYAHVITKWGDKRIRIDQRWWNKLNISPKNKPIDWHQAGF